MHEGSDSFGECLSEALVLPPYAGGQVRVEAGFSKQCLPDALSPPPLPSCHSDPLPEPRCSSDLTSSAISCLLLEPCRLYPSIGDAWVRHHCARMWFSLVILPESMAKFQDKHVRGHCPSLSYDSHTDVLKCWRPSFNRILCLNKLVSVNCNWKLCLNWQQT